MKKLIVGFSVLALSCLSSCALAQDRGLSGVKHLPDGRPVGMEISNVEKMLRHVARTQDTVVGLTGVFEIRANSTEKQADPQINDPVTLADSADEQLNILAGRYPNYEWQESENIIHVSRKGARISLADVVLLYPGAQNQTRMEMWMYFDRAPEVSAWLQSMNCHMAGDGYRAKNFKLYKGPISIPAGPITVGRFLDEIARQSGENYWSVLQISSPGYAKSCAVSVSLW